MSKAEECLPLEFARAAIAYDPLTGALTRKLVDRSSKHLLGASATYRDAYGYFRVSLFNRKYLAHRLAWFIHWGSWPDGVIDHINRKRDDNRMANLRDASRSINSQNRGAFKPSATGFMGATPHGKRFVARISVNGRMRHIGVFDTPEESNAAYLRARATFHGEALGL